MQKSLIVIKDYKKGQIIKDEHLSSMRPAKGIPVLKIDKIIGKKLNKNKISGDIYIGMISNKKIILIGGSGHAKSILNLLDRKN